MEQSRCYQAEISHLQNGHQLKRSHALTRLRPLIDHEGILRVGDHLQNSNLPFETKHPAIIPGSSHLAKLIIDFGAHCAVVVSDSVDWSLVQVSLFQAKSYSFFVCELTGYVRSTKKFSE